MPSVFRKRKTGSAAVVKNAFAGDAGLLQLHAETAELLRLVKSPTPSRQRAPPTKARVTIEVLDDDSGDEDGGGGGNAVAGVPSSPAKEAASLRTSAPRTPADPLAFAVEEARVRGARDTFYPDTTPTKQALDRQQDTLASEQSRLQRLARDEQSEGERKRQEVERHQRHKLPSRLDTSAVKIQCHARGFLCRKRFRQQRLAARQRVEQELASQWHEVRDVERGEVWYYNARTGLSQWEAPPGFASPSSAGGAHSLQSSTANSLPELTTLRHGTLDANPRPFNAQRASSVADLLPPLSPSTASACSSARSDANDALSTMQQSRASSSVKKTSATAPKSAPKPSGSLPMLPSPQRQQPAHATSMSFLPAVVSVANPWECDSVMGGSDESLCSQRTRDDFDDDDDDESSSGFGDESGRYAATDFARRRSTLEQQRSEGDGDRDPQQQQQESYDEAGDWQTNDTLFLADGSRNSKLRDTIRNALYVSKFDSISTLIASNVVLRKKPVKGRREVGANQSLSAALDTSANQRSSVGKKSASREIALGKRDAPMFVAVLSDERSRLESPSATKPSKSPKSVAKRAKPRAFGASPPRIRDLADPGFHDDLPQQESAAADDSSKKSAAVCFNCWSSSTGRFCDVHRDPDASRKVKAAESALMCANWDLDQLRRKHRAEEIQEVFMKQSASLRYDKRLKQYVTVVECRHPVYRAVAHLVAAWNAAMRRKLRARAWFRSFMEQLRAGRVPKADTATPALLKLRNTLQNNRWCAAYSDSVREFHPRAPVTLRNHSGQPELIPDVVMVHPARPQPRNWVLQTEYATPVELFRPREYELPPRRCVPMPAPSYLEDLPLPVPNVFIDCGHVASWLERLSARISAAALAKAVLQISACTPPRGFDAPRRTKHAAPLTVVFATFGRKPTPGNVAVGGLSAELLIHMLVTTYVPAQFGNLIVFERRALAPTPTTDHDAHFGGPAVLTADPPYVFRALEHALNARRAPCIVVATKSHALETEALARESGRFPANRPEQTGEELAHGFRTFWLVDALHVPDAVPSVLVQPNSAILSPNAPSMNATATTRADRFYPFCLPTTKENTPLAFVHLLWVGQSSRNQAQVFTTLGAQQPGEFMKNSDPDGALGACSTVIYRSWAFAQSSPVEEFITPDGVAYWYDKQSGETFWTRPTVPAERHRGKDGDVDGVIADGHGEVATLGVGADEAATYPQYAVRKYMTKSLEAPEQKERRVRQVAASAKKHDIVIADLSGGDGTTQQPHAASPSQRAALEKIRVPELSFKRASTRHRSSGSHSHSPVRQQAGGAGTSEEQSDQRVAGGRSAALDVDTKQLIDSITLALGAVTGAGGGAGAGSVDMLQLGIGLGMGLGLRAQQQQPGGAAAVAAASASARTSSRSDRTRNHASLRGGLRAGDLDQHDEEDDDEDDAMSTSRSVDSSDSGGSFSARSTVSTAMSVDISLPPDEQELEDAGTAGHDRIPPPGYMAKTPGYRTHAPPGEGLSWTAKPVNASAASQTAVSGFAGAVHQRVACLPKGFVAAVTSTKTCTMHANYLPVVRNTNEPRSVGFVRPRGALQEWLPVGYSPWSAGRVVFGTQFIADLMQRPELASQANAPAAGGGAAQQVTASGARAERREKVTQAMKESEQLEEIFSHCRHGKYDEVELRLNNPDWTLHIDAKDAMGNTLLSVACQNNNKRLAKLCMRRGADINTQNLNGQSVLHYCHEYGFHDLMDYLMEKGARDDVVNADGLTCYEGLSREAVDAL